MPRSAAHLPLFLLPLGLLLFAGCKKGGESCFVGDDSLPVEIEPLFRNADGEIEMLEDGDILPLITPPQGGKVAFIGVRARNIDGCPLRIDTALFDPETEEVVSLERRPIRLKPTMDGWLLPLLPNSIANYSNLPACPRAGLAHDIHGEPYRLEIVVTDKKNRTAAAELDVIPTCAEPAFYERCRCECRADYELGQVCEPVDGGFPNDANGDATEDDADDASTDANNPDGAPTNG